LTSIGLYGKGEVKSFPKPADQDTLIVNFDNGGFNAGNLVSEINFEGGRIQVFGLNPKFPDQNAAMIFDSGNPTGGDFDLGTPNEQYGGPGMNLEGGLVAGNDTAMHNVLIVSEDLDSTDPDDASDHEISLVLDFSTPVTLVSLDLLDLDSGEVTLILSDSAGNEIYLTHIPETGCNGIANIVLNIEGVSSIFLGLNGSGALDNLKFLLGQGSANTSPVAEDDFYSIDAEEDLIVDAPGVLENDSDADGDDLTIISFDSTSSDGGTVLINPDGSLTYTPPTGFEGNDSFSYKVEDEHGAQDTAVVTVEVTQNGDGDDEGDEEDDDDDTVVIGALPLAEDDQYETIIDTDLTINAPGVLTNDLDPNGGALTIISHDTTSTQGGEVLLNPDGGFTYTPAGGFEGDDSFTYVISNEQNGTDTATVTINVSKPENAAPVAVDDQFTTDQDQETEISDPEEGILINDSDPDGDIIAALEVNDCITEHGGRISINSDGTLVYTPGLGFTGADTYEYTICDDREPALCDSAIIYFEVEELPIEIYNAFSPNGDGINDTWIIQGITRFPDNKVQVFNRWGNLIYEETGYDNTSKVWNGESSKGIVFGDNEAPDGAYYYVVELGDGSETLKGFVVVRR
jgi:gliding motility-associated-like protein